MCGSDSSSARLRPSSALPNREGARTGRTPAAAGRVVLPACAHRTANQAPSRIRRPPSPPFRAPPPSTHTYVRRANFPASGGRDLRGRLPMGVPTMLLARTSPRRPTARLALPPRERRRLPLGCPLRRLQLTLQLPDAFLQLCLLDFKASAHCLGGLQGKAVLGDGFRLRHGARPERREARTDCCETFGPLAYAGDLSDCNGP